MYCIECGAQIPVNSKFCSHCGKSQNVGERSIKENVANFIIENEIVRQIVEDQKKSIDYQFLKKAKAWYFAWVLLNLGILLIFSRSIMGFSSNMGKYFYPFTTYSDITDYDIREFLVYTLFPLAILYIWSRLKPNSNKK